MTSFDDGYIPLVRLRHSVVLGNILRCKYSKDFMLFEVFVYDQNLADNKFQML